MNGLKIRETDKKPKPDQNIPPEGPHGRSDQTDKEQGLGTGIFPDEDEEVEGPIG